VKEGTVELWEERMQKQC